MLAPRGLTFSDVSLFSASAFGPEWPALGEEETYINGRAGRPAGPRGREEGTPWATHLSGSSSRRGGRRAGGLCDSGGGGGSDAGAEPGCSLHSLRQPGGGGNRACAAAAAAAAAPAGDSARPAPGQTRPAPPPGGVLTPAPGSFRAPRTHTPAPPVRKRPPTTSAAPALGLPAPSRVRGLRLSRPRGWLRPPASHPHPAARPSLSSHSLSLTHPAQWRGPPVHVPFLGPRLRGSHTTALRAASSLLWLLYILASP